MKRFLERGSFFFLIFIILGLAMIIIGLIYILISYYDRVNFYGNFLSGGTVIYDIAKKNFDDVGWSIIVDKDGNAYFTGYSGSSYKDYDSFIVKLNQYGKIDNTFGNNGKIILSKILNSKGKDYAESIALDSEQKILITGYFFNGKNFDSYILKLDTNGKIDKSFGKRGKVIFNGIATNNPRANLNDIARSIFVDKSQNIYIAGSAWNRKNYQVFIIKLNSNGKMDSSFGKNGIAPFDDIAIKYSDDQVSAVYEKNGKIYIAGWSVSGKNKKTFIIRIDQNGNLDNDFGEQGKVILDENSYPNSMVVDENENIFFVGDIEKRKLNLDAYLIKLNKEGKFDNSFADNGKILFDNIAGGSREDSATSLYIDESGKIYITGISWNGRNYVAYVIKLNSNGNFDKDFGDNGKLLIDRVLSLGNNSIGNSIFVDKIGRIYIVGSVWNGKDLDAFVVRLLSNGNPG